MSDTTRRRISAMIFVLACAALLATTPGPPTARSDAEGELFVGPGDSARVEVRYAVSDPRPQAITRLAVRPIVGYDRDARFSTRIAAVIEGHGPDRAAPASGYEIDLDSTACAAGCQILATIDAAWGSEAGMGLRVAWAIELEVEYEQNVPDDAVRVVAVSGGDESPARGVWLGAGGTVAVLVGLLLAFTAPRFAALRLFLSAGLLAVAAWPVVMALPFLERWLAGRLIFGIETLMLTAVGVILAAGVLIGIYRAAHGRATMLRIFGWIAVLVVPYAWWAIAINLGTYRPHELAATTAALGLFSAAAVTAGPLGASGSSARPIGIGTSLVMAIQGLLLITSLLVAGSAFVLLVIEAVSGSVPDLGALGLAAAAIATAGLFTYGWLDWRRGMRRNLIIGSWIAVIVVAGPAIIALLQPDDGFLSIGIELRVLAVLVMAIVLVGAIGVSVVDPPLADDQRDGEDGEGDEVPGVADEGDRAGLGDDA